MAVTTQGADLARWVRLTMPATGVVGTAVFFLVVFSPILRRGRRYPFLRAIGVTGLLFGRNPSLYGLLVQCRDSTT